MCCTYARIIRTRHNNAYYVEGISTYVYMYNNNTPYIIGPRSVSGIWNNLESRVMPRRVFVRRHCGWAFCVQFARNVNRRTGAEGRWWGPHCRHRILYEKSRVRAEFSGVQCAYARGFKGTSYPKVFVTTMFVNVCRTYRGCKRLIG